MNNTFDFATAVKYLQEGKKIRQTSWLPSDKYLELRGTSLWSNYDSLYVFDCYCFSSIWELYNG